MEQDGMKRFVKHARALLGGAAIATLLAAVPVTVDHNGASFGNAAQAQSESSKAKKKRRSQVIRNEKLVKAMNAAVEKMDEEDMVGALAALERSPAMEELSSYERSKLYQFRGSLYAQTERYAEATRQFEAYLREPDAAENEVDGVRFNLAQLYMVQGNFPQALTLLENWRKTAEVIRAQQEFLFCQAYLQTEAFKKALAPCAATLSKADEEGVEKRESWVVANVVAYQQNNQLEPATKWLKWLLVNYPKEQYWKQLSGMFSLRGMEKDEVAAYEIAYLQGFLKTESDIKRMAQLYQYHGVPIKATEVINKGFADGILKKEKSVYELLGSSYQLAREQDDAKEPLAKAAEQADKKDAGKLWERVAQIYIADEEWTKAADALAKAQRAGNLSNPYRTKVYEGMSLTYSGKFDRATKAFNAARKLAKTAKDRKQINGWLAFVKDQKRRADDRKKYGLKPYRAR